MIMTPRPTRQVVPQPTCQVVRGHLGRDLGITGMGHLDFTDYRPFLDQLGRVAGSPPELFHPLDGARALEACAYVRAFLDLHVKNHRQPLLRGPSPRFPEVALLKPSISRPPFSGHVGRHHDGQRGDPSAAGAVAAGAADVQVGGA